MSLSLRCALTLLLLVCVAGAGAAVEYALKIREVAVFVAEDGEGRVVVPVQPKALDVESPTGWPARALDPVLHVGRLHFHRYSFPSKEVMRFVVSDAATLPEGAEVWLQYGEDAATKVIITRSLEVPR